MKTFKKGCSICELEAISAGKVAASQESDPSIPSEETQTQNVSSAPSFQKNPPKPSGRSKDNGLFWIVGIGITLILLVNILSKTEENQRNSSSSKYSSSSTSATNRSPRDICRDNQYACKHEDLCYFATVGKSWDSQYPRHVEIAKSKNLCGITAINKTNQSQIELTSNGEWSQKKGSCMFSQRHPWGQPYVKTELAMKKNSGLSLSLYKGTQAPFLDTKKTKIKVAGKDPFLVEAANVKKGSGEETLLISNLNLFKSLFAKKRKVTITDGNKHITIPLKGSKRVIDFFVKRCNLE